MRTGSLVSTPMGGEGQYVEADVTFVGKKDGTGKPKGACGFAQNNQRWRLSSAVATWAVS